MVKMISLRSYIFCHQKKKKKSKKTQKIPQLGDTSKQVNFGRVHLHARGTMQLRTVSSLSNSGAEVSLPSSRLISLQWWQSPQALTMESFFPHLHVHNFWSSSSSLSPVFLALRCWMCTLLSTASTSTIFQKQELCLGPQHVLQPPLLCTCCGLWGCLLSKIILSSSRLFYLSKQIPELFPTVPEAHVPGGLWGPTGCFPVCF